MSSLNRRNLIVLSAALNRRCGKGRNQANMRSIMDRIIRNIISTPEFEHHCMCLRPTGYLCKIDCNSCNAEAYSIYAFDYALLVGVENND